MWYESGCKQDFEHCDEGDVGCEQDYCEEIHEHNVRNKFLMSDNNDETPFAVNELQIIDLSRSPHSVTPWTAKLPFDVEFDRHQGNFDIVKFKEEN